MKYYVKKDTENQFKCTEPCPVINKHLETWKLPFIGTRIGSGKCQNCKHHLDNDLTGSGKFKSLTWIKCEKLNEFNKRSNRVNE